jgi:Uma2 family endonuclease
LNSLKSLQEKMLEYIANGAALAWLIDPLERRVHIYRPGQEVVVLNDVSTVSADPVLRGFVLELTELW